jgi:hypothetical protein
MRRRLLLGFVPALPLVLLFSACDAPAVNLGLSMYAPEGLLAQATQVTLSVFDASLATCNPMTGQVSAVPSTAQTFHLGQIGCPPNDTWCTTIKLDKDGSTKMFAVVAQNAGAILATGCARAVMNQDPLLVDVQVFRYASPACCNDAKLEPGEQCDAPSATPGSCTPGGPVAACSGIVPDAVCNCDCTAKEILLSHDDKTAPLLKNGPQGSKSDLALSFGPGGTSNPEVLRAIYESNDPASTTGIDLHTSFLLGTLYPIQNPPTLDLQLEFPTPCNNLLTAAGIPLDQRFPSLATATDTTGSTVVTVYLSNQNNVGNNFDVFLSPQSPDGCVDTGKLCTKSSDCATDCDTGNGVCLPAVRVNMVSGGASDPHVASGPPGEVLVTWSRADGVYGRIWKTDGTMIPATGEIQIAPGGAGARAAGIGGSIMPGYTVVYQGPGPGDQDGVFIRSVDPFGQVTNQILVNAVTQGVQDQPNIAVLEDGTSLVVWRSGGNIFFQRFDQNLAPLQPADQTNPLNTSGITDGTMHAHPVVAGANGFFVVAWEMPSTLAGKTDIAARFVNAKSSFGYNSVNGQNTEFFATDQTINNPPSGAMGVGDRHNPAVAMSSFIAVGWEDRDPMNAGVWVRRFPPPM